MHDCPADGHPAWRGPGSRTSRAASVRGPGGAVEPLGQAASLEVLQLQEGAAIVVADVVDLHDVGVAEPGDGLGLGQEACGSLRGGVGAGQDRLQGEGRLSRIWRAL